MKRFILLLSLFLTGAVAASAQQVSFGVKGGLNIAKLTNADRTKTRAGVYAGAFANIALTEEWAIQPELLYSGQGRKVDPPIIDDYTEALNYINLPVMVQYHIVPEFHLEAGPQIGFLVAAKAKGDGNSLDIKDNYKGVDFGLGFGLGYTFDMGIGINARYNFGLTNVLDDSDNSYKNSVAQIGLSYTIGKTKR
ncbi:porin family protein [Chitinophaga lutea]